jgi:hypothetical protein
VLVAVDGVVGVLRVSKSMADHGEGRNSITKIGEWRKEMEEVILNLPLLSYLYDSGCGHSPDSKEQRRKGEIEDSCPQSR